MYTDFLYTHYLYNKNVHVYTWLYKYITVEISEPILPIHSDVSSTGALFEWLSFGTWTKGASVICVGLGPEFDALKKRESIRSHQPNSKVVCYTEILSASCWFGALSPRDGLLQIASLRFLHLGDRVHSRELFNMAGSLSSPNTKSNHSRSMCFLFPP